MFSGKLTDNGTRNSFLDTFHRSFNGINGDWYGSQQDATITNHFRLGTGAGNERGLLDRYQTDSGYRWTTGLSDAAAGEQFYQVLDELNNVYRLSIGQYNNGQSSTNNQTVLNAAGSGAVVLNGSSNSGTGGVIFGSGGPSEATVATISNTGNAQFNGTLQVAGPSTFTSSATVRNQADAEIDALLWAGLTAEQKESFIYKDHTGLSQWYMVKDASNNWALNSATGGLDSIKAYQSTNSGDTYINASNAAGVVRVNYEPGAGTAFNIYGGGSSALYASFSGTKAIKLPGLAAASGTNCLQIDNSGYITNTGAACGSASTTGTVNGGSAGQIAFYNSTGTAVSGMSAVPVSAGGTGASTPAAALATLGAASLSVASAQSFAGPISAPSVNASVNKVLLVTAAPYNAKCDGSTNDQAAIQAAFNDAATSGLSVEFPAATCMTGTIDLSGGKASTTPVSFFGQGERLSIVWGLPGQDVFAWPDNFNIANANIAIHDLSIYVDNSVDASGTTGSFPNRITGVAPGSGALTPAVGAGGMSFGGNNPTGAIVLNGASYNQFQLPGAFLTSTPSSLIVGGPLVIPSLGINATIVSVVDANNVTFTPAYTAAASGLSGTMLNGITPPWHVGNCGIAFPDSDGTYGGAIAGHFYNILIGIPYTEWGAPKANHTCGMFFQEQPYNSDFNNIDINSTFYGYIEALPVTNYNTTWTPDTSSYRNFSITSLIPWVSYAGAHRLLDGLSIYGGNTPLSKGPFMLAGPMNQAEASTVTHFYYECFGFNTGEDERWTGYEWTITGGSMGQCGEPGYINWLASDSHVDIGIGPNLNIGGYQNKFEHTEMSNLVAYPGANTVTDDGYSNEVISGTNQANVTQSARAWEANPIPYQEPVGKLDGSFLAMGSSQVPFLNGSDLVTTCRDWQVATTPGSIVPCINDPSGSEISKSYEHAPAGNNPYSGYGTTNMLSIVGTRFPKTKVYVITQARCEGTASCTSTLTFGDATAGTSFGVTCPVTYGSTWTLQGGPNSSNPCLLDLSTFPVGHMLGWGYWNFSGSPTAEDAAIVAFEPVNQDILTEVRLTGATGSIGGSALAAGACTSGTVSVTGASTGMVAMASPVTYPGDGMAWRAYVSSPGVVTVKVCADVAGTPAASAYNVRVLQ